MPHEDRAVAREAVGIATSVANDGHFWGQVQAIKRPTLFEITGPLFMSYPVVSNVQYRLSEVGWTGRCISFVTTARWD